MCRDFQVSVNSVRAVNSSLHDVTHKYTFKYIKLGTMIAKGGRDDAFQEVGCDLGLFDRPMLRDLQNMQAALEQSGKSIRKLRSACTSPMFASSRANLLVLECKIFIRHSHLHAKDYFFA